MRGEFQVVIGEMYWCNKNFPQKLEGIYEWPAEKAYEQVIVTQQPTL